MTTLSSTESVGNGRTSWKVRPMPRRQISSGVSPSMRSPAKAIEPLSGADMPAMMLNSVVLPAPLGPMTAKIEPCATRRLTLSTASRPRKRLLTASMDRRAVMRAVPLRRAYRRATATRRLATPSRPQADRVRKRPAWRRVRPGRARSRFPAWSRTGRSGECTDEGAEQRADATDNRSQDQLDRARNVKHLLREQIVVIEREEPAGDGSHAGRYDDRVHLVAKRVDAERARGNLILADRLPVIADATPEQNVAERECRDGQREHHIVEHRWIAAQVPKIVARIIGDGQ